MFKPTAEQQLLIDENNSAFYSACPGAGKTQTIAERYIQRKNHRDPKKGIALITFTVAAAEEAKKRCSSAPELLTAPNFIGTIDGFLNRYIARPVFLARHGVVPVIRQKWSDYGDASKVTFRTSSSDRHNPLTLDNFSFQNECAQLDLGTIKEGWVHANARKMSVDEKDALDIRATFKSKGLIKSGFIAQSWARAIAHKEVVESVFNLVELIAARFDEIIIDEAQDCNDFEISLVDSLMNAGVRVILVGDLDQSIFEFRGSNRENLNRLIGSGLNQPERMSRNFRSSPEVCKAVATLRYSKEVDESAGDNRACTFPVQLVSFNDISSVHPTVERLLAPLDQSLSSYEDGLTFLSREWRHAAMAAGVEHRSREDGSKKTLRLVNACLDLSSTELTPLKKRSALEQIGLAARDAYPEECSSLSLDQFAERIGLNSPLFREKCLRWALLIGDPRSLDIDAFKKAAKSSYETVFSKPKSGTRFAPDKNFWQEIVTAAPKSASLPRYSSIHSFKGLETEIAVVVLPDTQKVRLAVSDWSSGTDSEDRRLLYVAASRAEKLLIFAVHTKLFESVRNVLQSGGVSVNITDDTSVAEEGLFSELS